MRDKNTAFRSCKNEQGLMELKMVALSERQNNMLLGAPHNTGDIAPAYDGPDSGGYPIRAD